MKFKNQTAAAIFEAIKKEMAAFEQRKAGAQFRAMLFTLADVFPEDRHKIYSHFKSENRQKVKTGGAKITRKKHEKRTKKRTGGCDGCPDNTYSGYQPAANRVVKPGKEKNTTKPAKQFGTTAEILDAFEGKATAIMAYAQTIGKPLPTNITRAETAAKHLLDKINEEEE